MKRTLHVELWDDTLDKFVFEKHEIEECPDCEKIGGIYVELNHNVIDIDLWRVVCGYCGNTNEWLEGLSNTVDAWNKESRNG